MNEILPDLRTATADAHQCLEDAIQIERRVTDPSAYRQLLQIFLGFYRPLEARLFALGGWESCGLDVSSRGKTSWLENDLLVLGVPRAEMGARPDCQRLPPADSLVSGFGCLYVLEGATLGGRQITAMLRASLVPSTARNFFGSYGADTGRRWREFLGALENCAGASDVTGREAIVQAARETFACLQDWFVTQWRANEYSG